MLLRGGGNDIGLARVPDFCRTHYPELTGRSDDTRTPIAEAIDVGRNRDRQERSWIIHFNDVRCARIMDVQDEHHRRGPRTIVDYFVADSYFHRRTPRNAVTTPGLSSSEIQSGSGML